MELLDIFDQEMNKIGVLERNEVHRLGFWHQTFHCWFVQIENDHTYIYIQKRQKGKDTFPEKFDITVAGHLRTNETPESASREVEEEIGIKADFHQFVSLGIVPDEIITADFTDREFCHVYMYQCVVDFAQFKLQQEEVAGIYKVKLDDLLDLFSNQKNHIDAVGIELDESHQIDYVRAEITEVEFVPHGKEFYLGIFDKIRKIINGRRSETQR